MGKLIPLPKLTGPNLYITLKDVYKVSTEIFHELTKYIMGLGQSDSSQKAYQMCC